MKAFDTVQSALGFVRQQTAHIEAEVYRYKYPSITYSELIPVDSSAPKWIKTYTYRSMDSVGLPKWIAGAGQDIPLVDMRREEVEKPVFMGALGYRYSLEEINQAAMLGIDLDGDSVFAVREGYEQFIETLAFDGAPEKNFIGFLSSAAVTAVSAPNGSGVSPLWANKTPDEVLKDINAILSGIHTATLTVEMADTVLLPAAQLNDISSRRLTDGTMTIRQFIESANVYTARSGRPLTIREQRRLSNKGAGATARMVAYRRDPTVVKLHLPMPLEFLEKFAWLLEVVTPAAFRTGEVNLRRPGACRYMDGI